MLHAPVLTAIVPKLEALWLSSCFDLYLTGNDIYQRPAGVWYTSVDTMLFLVYENLMMRSTELWFLCSYNAKSAPVIDANKG